MENIEKNDRVKIISTKHLPPAWKLTNGMVGKVTGTYVPKHNESDLVLLVEFPGHRRPDRPAFPLHVSRVTLTT